MFYSLSKDHGGESGIGKIMEVLGDGVKRDEIVDREMFDHLNDEIGIFEQGFENVKFGKIHFV